MTVDDLQAEHLSTLAPSASSLTSSTSTPIQTLYSTALSRRAVAEQESDLKYLSLAPTFLSLHQQASSSKQLLSSLESFLSTFQSDLSTLSTHISALQTTSHQIDSRLDKTKEVEIQLASFLAEIALSPRVVELFFETEPESRPELWLKGVKQLERVLEATSPSATLPLPSSTSEEGGAGEVQAIQEVRKVAESCKHMVSTKLRTYLIHPHATIKSSVTTNLQVLQNSVLLRHHKPLYGFLARQAPRVAIDVQRSYVASARLYFETAFRRYTRSLGVIRKRWVEAGGGAGLIAEPGTYGAGTIGAMQNSMAALSKATAGAAGGGVGGRGSSTPATRTASSEGSNISDAEAMTNSDPWLFPTSRLLYSKLDSPVATVLGYLADDTSFKACPENLFRSVSLVLVDNACSEYTFLVRFFEGVADDSNPSSTEAKEVGTITEDSVSLAGDVTPTQSDTGPEASVVQLSAAEQSRLKGKGATEEIFRQIMEPSITTWVNFTKSLLTPQGSSASVIAASASSVVSGSGLGRRVGGVGEYFSLLSMLTLNDALLNLVSARGCSNAVLETALMGFKIAAYPLIKRFLDDQITTISSLINPSTTSAAGGMWGLIGSVTGSNLTSSSLTDALGEAIGIRYASLFTKTLYILTTTDSPDQGILSALHRLRTELAKLLGVNIIKSWTKEGKQKMIRTLIGAIEALIGVAGGLASSGTVQNEFSFWREQGHQFTQS